jgi:two-component system, OmpR family, response regulator MtrA
MYNARVRPDPDGVDEMPAKAPQIYILDDSATFLATLEAVLSRAGFEVTTFCHVMTAMTKIRLAPPDLLLVDIQMPFLDGDKICQQLRKKGRSTFPIIFCSGIDEADLESRVATANASGYIPKTLDLMFFPQKLFEFLEKAEAQAPTKPA